MITGSIAVIPARIGSSRLPRKPLQRLAGRTLIEWVWRRTVGAELFPQVVIATDSDEVAAVAHSFGAEAVLTRPDHPSGTDRVAEVAMLDRFRAASIIVNVQGDEPFVRPDDLDTAARLVADGWGVATVASQIGSVDELYDPAVVKVVRGQDGAALYFSRAAIPFSRDAPGREDLSTGLYLRHVGIYAYSRDALLRWVRLEESPLERTERLEQLRPLAAGIRIAVGIVPPAAGGIDTAEDLERAHALLLETSAPGI